MVLTFLQSYIATFPLILPYNLTIHAYCYNKGLMDQLNCKANQQYHQDTKQDDYPIIGEIQQKLQTMQPILVQIDHIKGHQDKVKLDQPLTIQETLNINCNKQASAAMLIFPNTTPCNHPMTPTGYPHLIIGGVVQFRHLQNQLQTAAAQEEYQSTYKTNFNGMWNNLNPYSGLPSNKHINN